MRCPFCNEHETRVLDSRLAHEGDQVRRRRECGVCKARFTTYEVAELRLPDVAKHNGTREPFNDEKLRSGFIKALEKRPVNRNAIEQAMSRIKRSLIGKTDSEVSSQLLGEKVMNELRNLDHVAYVRFASVYRSFEDVSEFNDVIANLNDES
ncbi:MAG: transcriptional regulator NrdR [Methylococcales bacterium]|nr:transcriptional regulator NrdR [Methylococcales bacterium]MDD5754961.1 transcriptional regulator NrdR [Methylococcales bacterium]